MKHILLCVAGLNPQVITETLHALHQSGKPVDAIHVATTREGRDRIQASLLAGRNGQYFKYKETCFAQIKLVHIPFISIRERLPSDMLDQPRPPAALFMSVVREEKTRLTIHLPERKIVFKTCGLDLPPACMALYAFFARLKKQCPRETDRCGDCTDCFLDIQEVLERQDQITEMYRLLRGTRPLEEMSDTGIVGLAPENFNSYKTKIKAKLQLRFGPCALEDLEIASVGARPNTKYGIKMESEMIEIVL